MISEYETAGKMFLDICFFCHKTEFFSVLLRCWNIGKQHYSFWQFCPNQTGFQMFLFLVTYVLRD